VDGCVVISGSSWERKTSCKTSAVKTSHRPKRLPKCLASLRQRLASKRRIRDAAINSLQIVAQHWHGDCPEDARRPRAYGIEPVPGKREQCNIFAPDLLNPEYYVTLADFTVVKRVGRPYR
jgi:hypothetical protein